MKRIVISIIVAILLLAGFGVVEAQDPSEQCFQRGGYWDFDRSQCVMKTSFTMEVAFPLGYDAYPTVATTIDNFVRKIRAEFLGTALLNDGFTQSGPGGWQLSVSYQEYWVSATVVSIEFDVFQYTGGANGFGAFETFVFDLAADRVLGWNDLFTPGVDYLGVIAPLARQSIATQYGIAVDDQWLVDGSAPVAANYTHFVLTPTELLVMFDEYQVGPGALGPVVAHISIDQLRGILVPGIVP